MITRLMLLLVLGTPLAFAADKSPVTFWPKGVPPEGIAHRDNYGSHVVYISHRDKDGHAELHKTETDIMLFQTGEATVQVGGEVIDPKEETPGQIQGPGIKGGQKIAVHPGDVLHVPAGVAHQFFLAPGKQITYFIVKVNEPSK